MKKYLGFIMLLSGCISKQESFQMEDYDKFCPVISSEVSSKEHIVYKSEDKDFYILPGDYILSRSELLRMPQNNDANGSEKSARISSASGFSNYLKDQVEDIKKIGINIKDGISTTKTTTVYPDKKLAKELVVSKYISTKDPSIVFCGLHLKTESPAITKKYSTYIIEQHEDKKLNDVYSGGKARTFITIKPYHK